MQIRDFKQASEVLAGFIPSTKEMGKGYKLERMRELLTGLGNPQESFKAIHVAGTSGKTSTCYYITAFLKSAGKKVGLTVSPHVDEVNERVQINLGPLPEHEFCDELGEFIDKVNALSITPSYFEVLVAFAFWEFAKQKVDYAVVETGLGGLLDATNVITRPDKVCVITDIGLDHTEVLGNTLPAITSQKAGIIQGGNEVLMYRQADEVMTTIENVCAQNKARLHSITPEADTPTGSLPLYLRRNWYLASKVYEQVASRDGLPALDDAMIQETQSTYIPARMEAVQTGGKTVIFDGAHNAQKLAVMADSMQAKYGNEEVAVLLSLSKNYDLDDMIRQIIKVADHIIVTEFQAGQDVPKQPISAEEIAEACRHAGFDSVEIVANPEMAGLTLLNRPEPVLLVTGSFYLLNHIRPLVLTQDD